MFFRATVLSLLGCLFFLQTLAHVRQAVSDHRCASAHAWGHGAAAPPDRAERPRPIRRAPRSAVAVRRPDALASVELAPATRLVDVKATELVRWASEGTPGARLVPAFRDGAPEGIKLYAIRPGSLLHALGLEAGDTLRAVNGVPVLADPGRLVEALSFEPRRFIDLELRRAGEPLRIAVLVHGEVPAGKATATAANAGGEVH